jgi:hypothetical protein
MLRLVMLLAISLSPALGGGGGSGASFDEDVAKQFAPLTDYRFRLEGKWPDSVIKKGSPNSKPIIVIVTQPWHASLNPYACCLHFGG